MQNGQKGGSFNQRSDVHVRDKQPFHSIFALFYPIDFQLTILSHISMTALVFPTNK